MIYENLGSQRINYTISALELSERVVPPKEKPCYTDYIMLSLMLKDSDDLVLRPACGII
jgi:hypothetical protein